MCDSDSEEFASADEDFEEIEPEELEEVLGSVKPADVSSKKAPEKQTSAQSDVEPVGETRASSNASKEIETSSSKDTESDAENASGTDLPKAALEEKKNVSEEKVPHGEPGIKREQMVDTDAPTLTKKENVPERALKLTNIDPSKETPSQTANVSKTDGSLGHDLNADASVKVTDISPPPEPKLETSTTASTSLDTVKPKKLILKPARPQLYEEKPKEQSEPAAVPEKVIEEHGPEEVKPPAEEGWDDFDDDWGDFSVGGDAGGVRTEAGGGKKTGQKEAVPAKARGEEQPGKTSKASFKDVDIDDVEDKLKDFMKHKDDPPLTSVLDRLSMNEDSKASGGQSWGSWKPSWGGAAVSFLSTASKSVASITTNITQVIESGIGVPNPEEMARRQAETEARMKAEGYLREESEEDEPPGGERKPSEDRFGFDQLVSGVTQISSKVISGGLDTLEGIGKKTMTILQENDPGLLNKRKLLGLQPNGGVVLSQVLREAKAKTEESERNLKQLQKHQYKKKLHFETLFDDYHGLVHLEALEMLSKQASLRLESLMTPLTGKALEDLQETMGEVKELCELPEMDNDDADGLHTADELAAKLNEAIVDLDPSVKVDFGDIVKSWTEYTAGIDDGDDDDGEMGRSGQDIFEKAMRALAQTTALCVLRMHKLAEILLISEHHSTATEADVVVQLTTVFCWHLSGVATRFCSELTKLKDTSADDSDNALITNIFLEGSNSTSYIQNAFQLFIPILQLGAA